MPGTWTTGPRTPVWAVPPVIGDGSNAQGGDPPALASEPAAIDEGALYTRTAWLSSGGIDRIDNGEAKFRITSNFAFFGTVDPLLHPGEVDAAHHHTFIGNVGVFENLGMAGAASATYASLRNNPKAHGAGGPLNATMYWEPTLFLEVAPGLDFPIKPNVVSFYYTNAYADTDKLYRLLRGLTFIGGCNPSDRFNTARLAEIPDGAGWDKTQRYDGWGGWQIQLNGENIPPAVGSDADINPSNGFPRQLVNSDGSDPWGGAAEDPACVLVANLSAPSAWDGHNLTSPNGRDHFRYAIRKSDNSFNDVGPTGWWKVPHFEGKTEFPGSRPGLTGHAYRSKLYLSSDRHGRIEANWHPRGSTMHFDWVNGWDSVVQSTWHTNCNGVDQGATPGAPLTCGNSTISATQRMLVGETPPDLTLAQNPPVQFHDYSTGPSADAFGPLPAGTRVSGTVSR